MNNQNEKFKKISRVELAHLPTPIDFARRLSNDMGCDIYIKRDDCTGLAGGGNKVRKLEYLLADAKTHGADTLITIGGLQSNHARQTAAVAAKFGMRCELVLEDIIGTPKKDYYQNGNVLLNDLLGANIHRLDIGDDCDDYAESLFQKLINEGKKPYLIPVGGSNVIGSLGYVRCAFEIIQQVSEQNLRIDQIVLASGSAGTHAGLLAGLIAAKVNIPVLGICVSKSTDEQQLLVESLLKELLLFMSLDPHLSKNRIKCNGDYVGEGYGIATQSMIAAVKRCAQLEGLLLDPVYTGKAMAGLIDLCKKGTIPKNSQQLFLHTGGSPALFSYQEIFQ